MESSKQRLKRFFKKLFYGEKEEINYTKAFYIELNGVVIGELTNCDCFTSFTYSCDIICTNEAYKEELFNEENWDLGKFQYRNKETLKYNYVAFPVYIDFGVEKKISMRLL